MNKLKAKKFLNPQIPNSKYSSSLSTVIYPLSTHLNVYVELQFTDMKALALLAITTFITLIGKAQNSQDKESVKKVVIAFQDDFNDGGFKNAIAYTTDDWEHINPGGGIDKGRDSVLKLVRAVHQTFLKGVTMTIESMNVRFITPGVAIADVIHKITAYIMPDGARHENERQIKTYVVVKQNGKWLLTHDHNTIIQGSSRAGN